MADRRDGTPPAACPRGCVDTDGCGCEWNAKHESASLFPDAPGHQLSEIPMQDDNSVWIWHRGREDYVLRCSCGQWVGKARGDTQATSRAMGHVLEHDIAYEEAQDDDE